MLEDYIFLLGWYIFIYFQGLLVKLPGGPSRTPPFPWTPCLLPWFLWTWSLPYLSKESPIDTARWKIHWMASFVPKMCFSLFFWEEIFGVGIDISEGSFPDDCQTAIKQRNHRLFRVAFPQLSAESSEEQRQIMCHHSHQPGLQCRPRWNSPNLTTEKKSSFKSASASMGFHQNGNLYDLFPLLVPGVLLATCHQK